MKLIPLLLLASISICGAAESTSTNPPPRRPPIVSPEVLADRHVTFHFQSSNVTTVAVAGEWADKSTPLELGTNGIWSARIGPIEPGIYGYSLTVDGVQMIDPSNSQVKPMRSPRTSILEVPGDPPLLSEFDPAIVHGSVHQQTYFSKALRRKRSVHVYTPPGYEQKRFGSYPVFYLLHGAGDNDATWTEFGRAQFILDNLIAQNKARPMIVVMTDGHAMAQSGQGTNYFLLNVKAFEDDLLGDVMPLVEKQYRIKRSRENRAIAGLSMGGGEALQIGLNHQELFAWVAGFSSFVPEPEKTMGNSLENADETNKRLKLLWVACGRDDFLAGQNKAFDEFLESRRIRHAFRLTAGKHNWPVWREYLAELAPQIFH